jgi:hypothetical protein
MDYINNTIGTVGTALNNTVSVVGRTVGLSSEEKTNSTPVESPHPRPNVPVAKPVSKSTVQTVTAPVDTPVAIAKPLVTEPIINIENLVKKIAFIKISIEDVNKEIKVDENEIIKIIRNNSDIKDGTLLISITYLYGGRPRNDFQYKIKVKNLSSIIDNTQNIEIYHASNFEDEDLSLDKHKLEHKKLITFIIEKIRILDAEAPDFLFPKSFYMFTPKKIIRIGPKEINVFVKARNLLGGKRSRKQKKSSKKSRKTRRNLKN